MNQNSTLSVRDDVAFGVYDVETDSPEVAVTQLSTHDFLFFEDDAARVLGKLLNGETINAICTWVRQNKEGNVDDNIKDVMMFLDEYASRIFVIDGIKRTFTKREKEISTYKIQHGGGNYEGNESLELSVLDHFDRRRKIIICSAELTWNCNLRCRHCYNPTHDTRDLLTKEEWFSIIHQLRSAGIYRMILTGGDPLCYPHFWEVAEEIHRNHIAFDVYTNGQILSDPKVAMRLVELQPRTIQCSLYGIRPETHDFITTIPGSWKKTVQCLNFFTDNNIPTLIKAIGMNTNYQELGELADYARRTNAMLQVDIGLIRKLDGNEEPLNLRLNEEQMVEVMKNRDLPLYQLTKSLKENLGKMKTPPNTPLCTAGRVTINIRPEGTVTPCINYDIVLGNLREAPFFKILQSTELVKVQSLKRSDRCQKCLDCEMEGHCTFCPANSLAEKGNSLSDCTLTCQIVNAYKKTAIQIKE